MITLESEVTLAGSMATVPLARPTKLWDAAGTECGRTFLYLQRFHFFPSPVCYYNKLTSQCIRSIIAVMHLVTFVFCDSALLCLKTSDLCTVRWPEHLTCYLFYPDNFFVLFFPGLGVISPACIS